MPPVTAAARYFAPRTRLLLEACQYSASVTSTRRTATLLLEMVGCGCARGSSLRFPSLREDFLLRCGFRFHAAALACTVALCDLLGRLEGSPEIWPAAALLFTPVVYAQTTYHLIPMPRQITGVEQVPLNSVTVECTGCDAEDTFAANDLRETLAERGIPTGAGLRIVLRRLAEHPDASFTEEMRAEGYTIRYAAKTLTLTGATAEGLFYAAQTAKQMIETMAAAAGVRGSVP